MIKIGNNDISDVKLGNTQVNSIYLGSTKVWEKDQYIDPSTLTHVLTKGTVIQTGSFNLVSGSGAAGVGYGDVNKDSIQVEFYIENYNSSIANLLWKTSSRSSTTRPDIGLFYTIASTTELNYNNVTTGTYAFKLEDILNGTYQQYNWYTSTLNRTAGSSSYPYRALSIGSTSGIYYGDKTSGSASAYTLEYGCDIRENDMGVTGKFILFSVLYQEDSTTWAPVLTIKVKIKEA